MPDLKPRHTVEELNRFIEVVRRHNSPELWITDVRNLNLIYRAARRVLVEGDTVITRLFLQTAIDFVEHSTVPLEPPGPWDDGPCGYYPGSAADPRD